MCVYIYIERERDGTSYVLYCSVFGVQTSAADDAWGRGRCVQNVSWFISRANGQTVNDKKANSNIVS